MGERLRVRGRQWHVAAVTLGENCSALRLTPSGSSNGSALTVLTPFDRPSRLDRHQQPRVVRPRRWLHELDRILLDVHAFGALTATARASIRLMPHQLEPALAIARRGVTRILIADGVGLGKTIQAGVILSELAAIDDGLRALVLVPAGLRDQWCEELATHFALPTVRADAAWLKATVSERPADVNPWSLPGIYLASYDFVKRPEALRPLEDVAWDLSIVDEAHNAAAGTDRRAAVHAIACRSMRVVLLTATPPAGMETDLAALCGIGQVSGEEPRLCVFARSREDIDLDRPRKSVVLAVTPSDAERQMHKLLEQYCAEVWRESRRRGDSRAALASIILRKRALSSASSLAASVDRRLNLLSGAQTRLEVQLSLPLADEDPLDDDDPSGALAAPGLANEKRERRWLAAIAEAARVAARAETKTRRLLRLLARLPEPVVVFTEYRDTLARLERAIAGSGREIVTLHGGMSAGERSRIPALFREGTRTLLATDAAAEGLNLHQASRIVIHYELPWNPARLEQRIGRVDRLGQTRRVHDIALVTADSAERLVLAPLARRVLRGCPPGSGPRLLHRLTESAVAETILSGLTLPANDEAASPFDGCELLDLRREALEETAGLEQHRRLAARSADDGGRARTTGPIVTSLRCSGGALRNGLVLIYLIAAETLGGLRQHAEPLVLFLPDRRASQPTPKGLRSLVEPFHGTTIPSMAVFLKDAMARIEADVSAINRARHARLQSRRSALAASHSSAMSAARQLVQQGLFDRRRRRQDVDRAAIDAPFINGEADECPPLRTTIAFTAAIALERVGARR